MKEISFLKDYLISEDGKVFSIKNNRYLKTRFNESGYECLQIRGKVYKIHRLVAIAYIENTFNKKCVNHIDGVKSNNHFSNLEWCTHSENNKHAYSTGLKSARHLRLHTDEDIIEIENLFNIGWRNKDISKKLCIPLSVVQKQLKGRNSNSFRHTFEERFKIKNEIINSDLTNRELSKKLNISAELIGRIKKCKSWGDITCPR